MSSSTQQLIVAEGFHYIKKKKITPIATINLSSKALGDHNFISQL